MSVGDSRTSQAPVVSGYLKVRLSRGPQPGLARIACSHARLVRGGQIMSGFRVPAPVNDPGKTYAPGTPERSILKQKLGTMSAERLDIPLVIGGKQVRTGDTGTQIMPHRHSHVLATWHKAGPAEVQQAIQAATEAKREWGSWAFEDRAAVFLRAADLLAASWRETINAATMLNQSKTAHQAEIDAVSESIDFLRFNVRFAQEIYDNQPLSGAGMWNRLDYRPLEGFVYAVTPFNFTSIGRTCRRRLH